MIEGLASKIELVQDRESREPFPVACRVGHQVIRAARKLGAILRPLGDVIVLMPPLSITPAELETLVQITREAINRGATAT